MTLFGRLIYMFIDLLFLYRLVLSSILLHCTVVYCTVLCCIEPSLARWHPIFVVQPRHGVYAAFLAVPIVGVTAWLPQRSLHVFSGIVRRWAKLRRSV